MHTGKLDMLGYRIDFYLTLLGDSVHFDLFGILNEFGNHDRMFLRHLGGKAKEAMQLVGIGTNVHGRAGKHIARAHEYGKTDLIDERCDVVEARELAPSWLIDVKTVEHG